MFSAILSFGIAKEVQFAIIPVETLERATLKTKNNLSRWKAYLAGELLKKTKSGTIHLLILVYI